MNCLRDDLQSLLKFFVVYQSTKTKKVAFRVESYKNTSVELLMHKRGRFQKHILHTSMVGLASIGFLSSGVIGGGNSIVASTFPIAQATDSKSVQTFDPSSQGVTLGSFMKLETDVSNKMRSEVVDYQVKGGETVSQIAEKFGISVDTIKWANNLDSVDDVKPGQNLKILPVSGVSYTVQKGDTLQGVAKKYSVDAQSIVDFPFNDIADDLQLTSGQVLIVPDGVPPEAKATPKPQVQSVSSGKGSSRSYSAPAGGRFIWPTTFVYISTYFSWWHPGIDLPNPAAPPIHAAAAGTVTYAGWDNTGYGNLVIIDHGNGYTTRYAHQSHILVTVGQQVAQGQTIGVMGSTGRSTGTHLHFEIRYNGVAINPLSILK